MLDRRDLADRLSKVESLKSLIQPYIQVISEEHTGLRLADVWRYFRLTRTNALRSVPARKMRFPVRDAAFPKLTGIRPSDIVLSSSCWETPRLRYIEYLLHSKLQRIGGKWAEPAARPIIVETEDADSVYKARGLGL